MTDVALTDHARQVGRAAFGATLVVGTAALVVAAVAQLRPDDPDACDAAAAAILGGTWAGAFAVRVIARDFAARQQRASSRRLRAWSLALPSLGCALAVPLTVDLAIAVAARGHGLHLPFAVACAFFAMPHVLIAYLLTRRAFDRAAGRPAQSGASILRWALLAATPLALSLVAAPWLVVLAWAVPLRRVERWIDQRAAREPALAELPRAVLR